MATYKGGCAHVHVTRRDPIDNHECHCNVCKAVTGQHTTHVAFFNYGDVKVDHPEKIKRVPFNKDNPGGPLEICLCTECGAVLMLDDKQKRIRVGRAERHGLRRCCVSKGHVSRLLGRDEGVPLSEGRPPGLWRFASRFRLADARVIRLAIVP